MAVEVKQKAAAIEKSRPAKADRSESIWTTVVRDIRLLLVAIWLGGAVCFSATVAPSAFAVLRARNVPYANEAAGSIVTRTLEVINISGCVIAFLILITAFLFRRSKTRRAFAAEVVSTTVVAVATGVGQWVIAERMLSLRAAMGRPIDDVAVDDPLRISFNTPRLRPPSESR